METIFVIVALIITPTIILYTVSKDYIIMHSLKKDLFSPIIKYCQTLFSIKEETVCSDEQEV